MEYKNNNRGRIHLRPPVAYYGGKQTLLPVILPSIPQHKRYVEPFLGGGAVYWSKEPSEVEVINDLDGFVINFYLVCKTDFEALLKVLSSVKGKFILTCYPSELLDIHLGLNPSWKADFRDMAKSAGSKGKRKTEVLVRNY